MVTFTGNKFTKFTTFSRYGQWAYQKLGYLRPYAAVWRCLFGEFLVGNTARNHLFMPFHNQWRLCMHGNAITRYCCTLIDGVQQQLTGIKENQV